MNPINKLYRVTSPYGMRTLSGVWQMHNGIDLVPADGKQPCDLFATVSGTIDDVRTTVPDSHTGLNVTAMVTGNYVNIRTTDGHTVIYRHMKGNSIPSAIRKGAKVTAGTKIGVMGTTGQSSGVHLHYEIRNPVGLSLDPALYLNGSKTLNSASTTLKIGYKIQVKTTAATYATGEKLPAWVRGYKDEIINISKDGKNILLKALYSWVRMNDAQKV
jgi:murein DD-endopeptidase MepM/ murein hydrolase activator NlpD